LYQQLKYGRVHCLIIFLISQFWLVPEPYNQGTLLVRFGEFSRPSTARRGQSPRQRAGDSQKRLHVFRLVRRWCGARAFGGVL